MRRGAWLVITQVAIAIALVVGLAIVHDAILLTDQPIYVAVSACAAGLFALGGMRRPWYFLAILVVLWVVLPTVFDSSAHEFFTGCLVCAWLLGAAAGGVIRGMRSEAWRSRNS